VVHVNGALLADESACTTALQRVRERGQGFVWLSLEDPDDHQMQFIAETFDLHPLAMEHAVRGRARPKVEWYDHHMMVAMRTLTCIEHLSNPAAPPDGQIAVFVGRDFLVTCGRGEDTVLADVRRIVETEPSTHPAAVLHAIADRVVGTYLETAVRMRMEADLVEEKVFSQSTSGDIERIYFLKREIVRMRRSIEPLTHALREFTSEHGELISVELRHNMRDVMEQNIHAVERIVNTEALLDSLLETAYGREGTQQNVDMRKISAWAAMGAVPTTVAGIYGMRFPNMPELHWAWGYPAVLTGMVVVTALLYRTFRRKRWL
jgi:magnesium transporter